VYAPLESGANAVWQLLNETGLMPLDERSSISTGAVYVFSKTHAVKTGSSVEQIQRWTTVEHSKLQSSDQNSGDLFGSCVAIDGQTLAVGAPGNSGAGKGNAGAAYVTDAGFSALSFEMEEVRVLEGTDSFARITVSRNTDVFADQLVFDFATSDLSAKGIDSAHYTYCTSIAANLRGINKCGDYEQTQGTVVMGAGLTAVSFTINIINDLCKEKYLEWFQVTLSLPGGNVLAGEQMMVKVRIDDDDFTTAECT
jgi:hypothetical protein